MSNHHALYNGYYITFGGAPISWKSKKQLTVSLSSVELGYHSMRKVCAELAWLSNLFQELEVPNITPIHLKCDNLASIYIASNLLFHKRMKYIEIDCHYVWEQFQVGLINLSHVSTIDQNANIFTKPLQSTLTFEGCFQAWYT